MTWAAVIAPVLVALVAVLLPGLVAAYSFGARGVTAWGAAPGLTMTGFTVLGLGYGVLHVRWDAATVSVGMAIVLAVIVALALLLRRHRGRVMLRRDTVSVRAWALGGSVVAAVLITARFVYSFGRPDAVSQTYDAVFHLNGVRYILDTGDASPFTFSSLGHAFGQGGAFYPNLWHMIASLVVQATGGDIPLGVNALSIVIGAVVWPLSMMLLLRQIVGERPIALAAGIALSACFAAFPLLLVRYGVLYPNLLGFAMFPASLAMLVAATRLATDAALRAGAAWILFVVLLPGQALAHPLGFIALILLGAPVGLTYLGRWLRAAGRRRARGRDYAGVWAIVVVVVMLGVAAFVMLRPSEYSASWGPTLGPRRAAWNVLVNDQFWPPAIVISVLIAAGVVSTFVLRRHRWLVASVAIVDALYVLTAWLPVGPLRYWVTGSWYSDVFRTVALGPSVLVPVATLGLVWIGTLVARLLGRRGRAPRGRLVAVTTAVLAVVVVIAAQYSGSMAAETSHAVQNYRLDARSKLMTADDRAVIAKTASLVPADDVIAGDPWTGSSLVWALADRRPLVPNINATLDADQALILESLRTATPGSKVCEAVRRQRAYYAVDFGTHGVFGPVDPSTFPGVHHLAKSKAMTLVYRDGTAALYRVTACG